MPWGHPVIAIAMAGVGYHRATAIAVAYGPRLVFGDDLCGDG